jgi:NhaA family Na+:H+ antiporter
MIVPATIYAGFTWGTPAMSGWGIPMATDIAFALGALAFFGRKLPGSLRIFLTALAVLDDLGSIVLIAFFYTQKINLWALTAATLFAFLLWKVAKAGEPKLRHFALLGFMLWLALFKSGVQPTLAGVITAFAIPTHLPALEKLENFLKPWINYGIIPAFAIANAGISFSNENSVQLLNPICMGVLFGLLIGKPIGILLFAFLGTQFNLTRLPHGVSWMQFAGVAALGGIGFTVSIFVAQLTFTENFLLSEAKLGILLASFIATVAGGLALRVASHLKLDSSLPIK